jgi:hypothetical protein
MSEDAPFQGFNQFVAGLWDIILIQGLLSGKD